MDIAVDSPIISKLFTQGRHRNASVILLLQNAYPKGKYNTSISRNAQYMALFRCPADRRQIGIVVDRIFDKNKPAFVEMYNNITPKPYSYVIVDNKANTPSRRQVIAEVFRICVSYNISGVDSTVSITKQVTNAIRRQCEMLQNRPFQNIKTKRSKRSHHRSPGQTRVSYCSR